MIFYINFIEPICGLDNSQSTINIIRYDWITSQVKTIVINISYIYEQFDIQRIVPAKILTQI